MQLPRNLFSQTSEVVGPFGTSTERPFGSPGFGVFVGGGDGAFLAFFGDLLSTPRAFKLLSDLLSAIGSVLGVFYVLPVFVLSDQLVSQ